MPLTLAARLSTDFYPNMAQVYRNAKSHAQRTEVAIMNSSDDECQRGALPIILSIAIEAEDHRIMRLLLWNIRYASGHGPQFHFPIPGAGYLRSSRINLGRITSFIQSHSPDIVGLIEVDTGSIRSGLVNQAEEIAKSLGHFSIYQCKYGHESLNRGIPIVRKQANAFLAAPSIKGERFHYFDTGIKRLTIELELDELSVFLVHLSLKYRHRHYQLRMLHELIKKSTKPVIVAGDFNTFWGEHEIYLFMEAAGLTSANRTGLPTYPARAPRKELDFILFGKGIEATNFETPLIEYSDHLPLICDFELTGVCAPRI